MLNLITGSAIQISVFGSACTIEINMISLLVHVTSCRAEK